MSKPRLLLAVIAGMWGIAIGAGTALADGSSISPTRLVFAKSHISNSITITNAGPTLRRYSVAAYAWDQADTNPIALTGTNDVVFFPGSFSVGPYQSQRIRVGTVTLTGPLERTYRVVVTELPPLQTVPHSAANVWGEGSGMSRAWGPFAVSAGAATSAMATLQIESNQDIACGSYSDTVIFTMTFV